MDLHSAVECLGILLEISATREASLSRANTF